MIDYYEYIEAYRHKQEEKILAIVKTHQPISHKDLAKCMALDPKNLRNYTTRLQKKGLLIGDGKGRGGAAYRLPNELQK